MKKMNEKNFDLTLALATIAVVCLSAAIAAFLWAGTTMGLIITAVAVVLAIIAALQGRNQVLRNMDEQTRQSSYKFNKKTFILTSIIGAAVVFTIAILLAPVRNVFALIPIAIACFVGLYVAYSKKKYFALICAMMAVIILGTAAFVLIGTPKAQQDSKLDSKLDQIIDTDENGNIILAPDKVVTPELEVQGNIEVEKGDINVNEGDIELDKGNVNVNKGNVNIDKGDINVEKGDINVNEGDINVEKGDINVNEGDINVEKGDVNVGGDLNVDGDVNVGGDINTTKPQPTPTVPDTTKPQPTPTVPDTTKPQPTPTVPDTTKPQPTPTVPDTTKPQPTETAKNPQINVKRTIRYGETLYINLVDIDASNVRISNKAFLNVQQISNSRIAISLTEEVCGYITVTDSVSGTNVVIDIVE